MKHRITRLLSLAVLTILSGKKIIQKAGNDFFIGLKQLTGQSAIASRLDETCAQQASLSYQKTVHPLFIFSGKCWFDNITTHDISAILPGVNPPITGIRPAGISKEISRLYIDRKADTEVHVSTSAYNSDPDRYKLPGCVIWTGIANPKAA